jgi:putative ABC transport system permease protein
MMGRGLASQLGVRAGSRITVMFTTVKGGVDAVDLIVKAVFESASKPFDNRNARIDLGTLQELLRTTAVEKVVVLLPSHTETQPVLSRTLAALEGSSPPVEARRWDQLNDFYLKTVQLFSRVYLVLGAVMGLLIAICAFSVMSLSVLERGTEIGTLRALGRRRSDIFRMFLFEGMALGAAAGVVGGLIGVVFTSIMGQIGIEMPPPPGGTLAWLAAPTVEPLVVAGAFLFSIIICTSASTWPALRAARWSIADALRNGSGG